MSAQEDLWKRAQALIPWGTQTNAKRPEPQLAPEQPRFIVRGQDCHIWDEEGREYIDYRSSLGPVILGHGHPEVLAAVRAQLELGVLFSMASPLEVAVAGAVREAVPCAEMVRFLKTGADANSACVRLARAYTGRRHLIICGYHGWHDTFAPDEAGRACPGVLDAAAAYSHRIAYGDLEAARALCTRWSGDLAAVLTVPYEFGAEPCPDFLAGLRELTTACGALLIFDEVLTGFRLARGGGQAYFGITPDLASLAKALANGFPLSAFVGRRQVMADLCDTFISTTHAGEALSLAAAGATLRVMASEPVHEHLWAMGQRLASGLQQAANVTNLPARAHGLAVGTVFRFATGQAAEDRQLRNSFFRRLLRQGIFPHDTWLISYAHTAADIDRTIEAAYEALREMARE